MKKTKRKCDSKRYRELGMLKNTFGILLYHFLRNDLSWWLLGEREKKIIKEANYSHNTTRPTYKSPERYGDQRCSGGQNWDNFVYPAIDHWNPDKIIDPCAMFLAGILNQRKPQRVLEIGPGAGYYTRLICENLSVAYYTGIDINQAFLDYLKPHLSEIRRQRMDGTGRFFDYKLLCADATFELVMPNKFDLIILLSTVHHIPDRAKLFNNMRNLLADDGVIVCYDPSHYVPRILKLIKGCICDGYLTKKFRDNLNNLSTHNMCSIGEYKAIAKKAYLTIENIFCIQHPRFERFIKTRWFSKEIGIVLK